MRKKYFILLCAIVANFLFFYSLDSCLAQGLPDEVTSLLQQCFKSPDILPEQAVNRLQLIVNRNDATVREIFIKEAIKIGGGGEKGTNFQRKVFEAIDRRQFQLSDKLVQDVAKEMGDGVEMVIRTGSSGSRHMQIHNKPLQNVRYDLLVSDDDISFIGVRAEEAAAKFNALKKSQGLSNARISAFSLPSVDATSYDLLVEQIRNPDAFVGAAGFGKIREEIVEKGGAVILTRQGNRILPIAQTVQDYVSKNAGSTLAEIMDVAAIAADLKKFGPLTMYGSAIRQMGHANVTQREQVKYLLRIHAAMDAAGSFTDAAFMSGRKASHFQGIGKQLGTAYQDKTGKAAAEFFKKHSLKRLQLEAYEAVMLSTSRKLQLMVAKAEKEAGKGAINIARHSELRRMIHEMAAGFALMNQTGHAHIMREVVPDILKKAGKKAGDIDLLYKVLYTAAFDAATLTAEAAQTGVAKGVTNWSRIRHPEGLITAMSEAGPKGRHARQTLTEAASRRMQGKSAKGAEQLGKVLAESNGDAFLWKMLSSETAKKFMIEGLTVAPFAAWTMYQEWQKGEMKDLSDAAFVLIDFVPGGMTTKKLGTEGLSASTVLTFAKEALYFSPAWPFVLAGDLMYLSWTVGDAIQLQGAAEGLVDILVYNGNFEVDEEGAKFTGLTLPNGTTYSRDRVYDFLFKTKFVRVYHAVPGIQYNVNNLSEKAFKVLDEQFVPQDATMEHMRLAIQQHLDAINWSEASEYFYRGNVVGALSGYVKYVAGFESVIRANKDKPWARLYEYLQSQMAERRTVLAEAVMVPQLILLAEQKRTTLDASKTLPQELAALQKEFEQLRGSSLKVQLVDAVETRAKKAVDALTQGTTEEKLLASGQVWQEALAAYGRVWKLSANIISSIEERTGYPYAKPLQFVWKGDPKDDLRKAEQSKLGFALDLGKIRRDLTGIAKREPNLSDSVDRQAYFILANEIFNQRAILDLVDDDGSTRSKAFTKEYNAALEKVKALYGLSQELQAHVEQGAALVGEHEFLVLDKAMSVELRLKDDALKKEVQQGGLKITWLAGPECIVNPSGALQVRVTTRQLKPVTVTVVFERTGATKVKAALAMTLPVRVDEKFLSVRVTPATAKPGQSITATADIPHRFLGKGLVYRWACENCRLEDEGRITVGLTAGQPGQGRVRVILAVPGPDGDMEVLTSGYAKFAVLDNAEPPRPEDTLAVNEILPPLPPGTGTPSQPEPQAQEKPATQQKDSASGTKAAKTEAPTCTYEYSAWSECDRATKKQTRTVIAKKPEGCVERQKPVLEQSCTPPPTEEEKRFRFLSCVCRCASGWAGHIGVYYDPQGKYTPERKSSGPCFGGVGAFGYTSRHSLGGSPECIQGCWEAAYGQGTFDEAKVRALFKEENKKYNDPLTVKIVPSKNPVDYGESLTLRAEVNGGSGSEIMSWGGCAEATDKTTTTVTTHPECKPCTATLTVTDQDGNSASDSLNIKCNPLRVVISRRGEGPITVGMPVSFSAQVLSGDKPVSGPFIYHWQPHPEVAFDKLDAETPDVQAVFPAPGKAKVWVTVLEKRGSTVATVAESEDFGIEVIAPELALSFQPADPLVGQEVKARLSVKPDIKDIDLRWLPLASNAWQGPVSQDGREMTLYLKDDKPVRVAVLARVPFSGEGLGQAEEMVMAKKYEVAVTGPKVMGPPVQIWKEGVGLVPVEKDIAVHQIVEFSASLQPSAADLTYSWKVTGGECRVRNPSSRDARVTASAAGTCQIMVSVRDKNKVELGTGHGQFTATVTQEMIDTGKRRAKNVQEAKAKVQSAREKARQGDYDGAITEANAAAGLDPANTEAATLAKTLRQDKEGMDRHLRTAREFMDANRFAEARQALANASKISSAYKPVQELTREIQTLQTSYERAVQQKMEEIRSLNKNKEFAKALETISAWRAATRLDPATDKALQEQQDWANKWKKQKDTQLALLRSGANKHRSSDFAGAIKDFEAGLANGAQIYHGQEPEYKEALSLQAEAIQKQKSLDEILTKVGRAVAKGKDLTLQEVQAVQALTADGLALQATNKQLIAWRNQLSKLAEDAKRAEAKKAEEARRTETAKKAAEAKKAEEARRAETEKKAAHGDTRIVLAASVFDEDQPIEVVFESLPATPNNWVTLVPQDFPDSQYREWAYTGDKSSFRKVFNGQKPGTYEVRVYYDWPKAGYVVQVRKTLTVRAASSAQKDQTTEAKKVEAEKKATEAKKAEEARRAEAKKAEESRTTDAEKKATGVRNRANYLGCFKDTDKRDLSGYSFESGQMSTDMCLQTCREKGFAYAGTQFAYQCFCGNSYGKYGSATNCDAKCSGKPGEICGGTWANSIYQLAKSAVEQQKGERQTAETKKASEAKKAEGARPASASANGASLHLQASIIEPSAKFTVQWRTPPGLPSNAWAGLIPSDVAHGKQSHNAQKRINYEWLHGKTSGELTFTAPQKEGSYDIRISDPAKDQELVSVTFKVQVNRAAASLSLPKKVYAPNEPISVSFTASAGYPGDSWVGLIPSDVSHGKQSHNAEKRTGFDFLHGKTEGELTFTAPQKEGSYDLRMSETSNDKELTSVTFKVAVPVEGMQLALPKSRYAPNEKIQVRFTAPATLPRDSWIGLIPSDVAHGKQSHNAEKRTDFDFLHGKTEGELTFTAPQKEGFYDLRMSETSNDKELTSVTFKVAVPMEGMQLALPKSRYAPGEKIQVRFTAPATLPGDSWIGLIPSDVAHGKQSHNAQKRINYEWLHGKTSGELTFTAPQKEGSYDLRMSESSNDKELTSVTFKVAVPTEDIQLSLPKSRYAPNEKIQVRFTAPATLPGDSWIGLIPSDVGHGKQSHNAQKRINYEWLHGKTSGELTFTAPQKEGSYDLRMNESSNDKELLFVSFQVVENVSSGGPPVVKKTPPAQPNPAVASPDRPAQPNPPVDSGGIK